MRNRTLLLAPFAAVAMVAPFTTPAQAATETTFTQAAFTEAQHAGKPILVYISATWCPTCAAQKPTLTKLFDAPDAKDLLVYHVDFDSQKDVVREMGARMQSTLIVFHGEAEKGRSTGDTNPASIAALVSKANQ